MFFFLIFFWGGEDLDVGVCLHTSDFKHRHGARTQVKL